MDPACSKKKKFTWATPKMKKIYIQKYIYQFKSFQKHFILSKYQMFWLSCDFFSILCDVSCQKRGHFQQMQLSSQNSIRPVNAMLFKRLQTTLHMINSMQCCPKGSRQHGTQKIQAMLSEQHLVFPFTYIIY